MYINQIDELIDNILDNFYDFLLKEKVFDKLNSDINFVKFQNNILEYIKKFIDNNIIKTNIIKFINKKYEDYIINIIKRYCAFYIYLGIAYNYTSSRELFITNLIEASKSQKDATFQISNFFNSENNSKIVNFYVNIKNFLSLLELKSIDKIKIILENNPVKYDSTIKIFNELGEDYINDFFLIKDNFHNMMKVFIFKQIYLKEEKNEIINIINQNVKDTSEYKYIDIIVSTQKKIVDFNFIQKSLTPSELKKGLAEDIYNYLEENRDIKDFIIKENEYYINYLFTNEILIPITEDFLRYHKDSEKYDTESYAKFAEIKERESTKIKYIVSKINNIKNYYSPLLEKNPKLKLEIEKFFYKQLDPKMAVLYNNDEEVKIIKKLEMSSNASDYDLLIDLENIRKYAYTNFKNLSREGFKIRPTKTIQAIRYSNIHNKGIISKEPIDIRIGNDSIELNVVGVAWNPSKISLDCIYMNDLLDVRRLLNTENGYEAFNKVINKTIEKPTKKVYYWLFNTNKDKAKLETYNVQHNIKVMLEQIYYNYINLIKDRYIKYISSFKELNYNLINKIIKKYERDYFDFNLVPNIKNELIEYTIINKIPELKITYEEDYKVSKKDIIKLPIIDIKKYEKSIFILEEKKRRI